MAGETIKTGAICLQIRPWSRTSHIVTWLTPIGRVTTAVKGAVRPKSFFLGQYDLNYTCEIVYYARARGEIHALKECVAMDRCEALRGDYRLTALAEYFGALAGALVSPDDVACTWFELLSGALARLERGATDPLAEMLAYELAVLRLAGLNPVFDEKSLVLRGERSIPISYEVAHCLQGDPRKEKNSKILLDAARVIGVFYSFHLDSASEARRQVLNLILKQTTDKEKVQGL